MTAGLVVLPAHDLNGAMAEVQGAAALVDRDGSHRPWVLPLRRFVLDGRTYNIFTLDGTSTDQVQAVLRGADPADLRRAQVSSTP